MRINVVGSRSRSQETSSTIVITLINQGGVVRKALLTFIIEITIKEESHSGPVHTLGKRASESSHGFESHLLRQTVNYFPLFHGMRIFSSSTTAAKRKMLRSDVMIMTTKTKLTA